MKDINTFQSGFLADWRAVIDFLAGIPATDKVRRIEISKEKDKGWGVSVNVRDRVRKKQNPYAGLYDLFW